ELSEATRGAIIALRGEGYSYRDIADKQDVSFGGVRNTILRAQKYHTTSSLPRSGRPRVISDRMCRRILLELRLN
ncbi:hypothetical protein BDV93DRAFT_393360, partial [Ceratobasidium sp. AG-I]